MGKHQTNVQTHDDDIGWIALGHVHFTLVKVVFSCIVLSPLIAFSL